MTEDDSRCLLLSFLQYVLSFLLERSSCILFLSVSLLGTSIFFFTGNQKTESFSILCIFTVSIPCESLHTSEIIEESRRHVYILCIHLISFSVPNTSLFPCWDVMWAFRNEWTRRISPSPHTCLSYDFTLQGFS